MSAHPIKLDTLRELAEAGAIRDTAIIGQKGGFAVVAKLGMQERPLATKRGAIRMFGTADAALRVLRDVGITRAQVDTEHFQAARLRPARRDVSRRAEKATEALAHDRWFRGEVERSLARLENGEATLIPHDTVWDGLEAYAQELVDKREAANTPAPSPGRRRKTP